MQRLPQTKPFTHLRQHQDEILSMMDNGPVVLMNRSTPRAVLVNPEMWNATADRLAYLEAMLRADAASARVWGGEYDTVEDVERMMAE